MTVNLENVWIKLGKKEVPPADLLKKTLEQKVTASAKFYLEPFIVSKLTSQNKYILSGMMDSLALSVNFIVLKLT